MKSLIAGICLSVVSLGASVPATAQDTPNPELEFETAKDVIWQKELGIYSGRGKGDLMPYVENTATGYSAWPPYISHPNNIDDMKAAVDKIKGADQEELAMEFVSFTLNGTTAIIYYQTHMTRTGDGRPVDARYEVTHTWTYENGVWKVLGGMARSKPERD